MLSKNDLELCRYFLNADEFRRDYSAYPLVKRSFPRDAHGAPVEYSEVAERMGSLISDGFRETVSRRQAQVEQHGDPVWETLELDTGDCLSVSYPEIYAMLQLAKQLSDDLQVEITLGLNRLLRKAEGCAIFLSLCKSIYIFWNYPPLQKCFTEEQLSSIDGLQRYLNGALFVSDGNMSTAAAR